MRSRKSPKVKNGTADVGIIGLGIIGSRVADRCHEAGLTVTVWNRTRGRRAGLADSPADVAARAPVVHIFVADDAALRSVVDSMAPVLTSGHTVINSSTVSLEATLEVAAVAARAGASFLDCPFTGSRNAAATGQLTYYVGGDASVLKRVRPLLEHSAQTILLIGKIGQATVLKIATNMISATTVEILAEAMGVVAAHGIPLETFARAMDHNACSSGLTRMKIPSILRRDFEPHFSLKNMLKDARLASALAAAKGIEIPALAVAAHRMAALTGAGRGDRDYSILATNYLAEKKSRGR